MMSVDKQIERLRQILETVRDERVRAEALVDLDTLRATLEVQASRLIACHTEWPRDERGEFATQEYVDCLLRRPRVIEPQEVHWILEAWGVPSERFEEFAEGLGARMVQESWGCLMALMPNGQAATWMSRPNDNELFGGQPPLGKLLDGQSGLAAIHHLLMGRMNNW